MKHLKQGIAAFLAALLIMPTLPAAAEGTTVPATSEADQVWFNTGNLAVSVIDPSVSEMKHIRASGWICSLRMVVIPSIFRKKIRSSLMRYSLPVTERPQMSGL